MKFKMEYEQILEGYIPVVSLIKDITPLISEKYSFPEEAIKNSLSKYINSLRDNLWVYVEYPYVDKVYRDSYYNYFSSKHLTYPRNSIRLSFFDGKIQKENFRRKELVSELNEKYLGFIVIRPTLPNIVGRSMISPKALKESNFLCCIVKINALVNGVKLDCFSFPHASQDTETLTCAETSIWSVMEYFGNKYPEYKPVLPSQIITTLSKTASQRLLPSEGLNIYQISLALKEYGFGTMIYSSDAYDPIDFKRIFNYYIESGIPIIANLQNNRIGHVVVFIGHENYEDRALNDITTSYSLLNSNGQIDIIDFADIPKRYVIIDDNYPPYQMSTFESPSSYYQDTKFKDLKITNFVVPLYQKTYLEASKAHKLVLSVLKNDYIGYNIPNTFENGKDNLLLRLFLTSNRSFKSNVLLNSLMDEKLKDILLLSPMPKFIWVAELSNKSLYSQKKAFGYIIVDATGNNSMDSVNPIVYPRKLVIIDNKRNYNLFEVNYGSFSIYLHNLKGEWCKWKT